jgi:hypothetical protein
MPTPKRDRGKPQTVEVPPDLAGRLEELLAQTGRSLATEVRLALEFWLERQGIGEAAVEPEVKPPARRPRPR